MKSRISAMKSEKILAFLMKWESRVRDSLIGREVLVSFLSPL